LFWKSIFAIFIKTEESNYNDLLALICYCKGLKQRRRNERERERGTTVRRG
jgi:hypothetical protein